MSISHERAGDLAAAVPAFRLADADARNLAAHLLGCPACARRAARLRTDLDAIGRPDPAVSPRLHDLIREAAVNPPRTGPSVLGMLLAFVLLAVAAIGVSAGVGAFQSSRPPASDTSPDAVSWQTEVVALSAKALWIDTAAGRLVPPATATVRSDPGDTTRWTLEVDWTTTTQQRLNLYFKADAGTWWIDSIRIYDATGAAAGGPKWIELTGGPWARTPIGQGYAGTLDIVSDPATGTATLHLDRVRIAVHPLDHVRDPLPNAPTPSLSGLLCSGVLQLPPSVADARLRAMGWAVDWRWQYRVDDRTGQSEVRTTPPESGSISDAVPGPDGTLVVMVQDPARPMMPALTPPPSCATR